MSILLVSWVMTNDTRLSTLCRYAREQGVTRARAGKLTWLRPVQRPWVSLRRWVVEHVLVAGEQSVRLYARDPAGKEVLLSDFALPSDQVNGAPTAELEARVAALEARLAHLEELLTNQAEEPEDQEEGEEEEESEIPPWAAALGNRLFARVAGAIGLEDPTDSPTKE